ncbi:cAMP receptor protein [Actinoalloteichus hoggarensis]|uniref:cAMP receptor protein n=2 Tax=Actinoalloteichus hoggarensis TaxID=1470176 RepID=A0A221W699_9PSEU|nr:cAMP receptor protein [Actinoalloteichus hoggarensis]
MVQDGARVVCPPGHRLLSQGEPGGWVLLSVAGRVKVTYAAPDGRELLVAIRGPGDLIGEFAVRDGGPRSATVRTIEPCILSRIPPRRFGDLLRRLRLESASDRYIVGKIRQSSAHAWRLAHGSVAERLAWLLRVVIDAAGPDHRSPNVVPMSQEEIATALGLVRSAITPTLAAWRDAGVIRQGRGRIEVLDTAGLTAGAR